MNTKSSFGSQRWRQAGMLTVLLMLFSMVAMAQNTKGDRPSKPLPRVTQKTKAKPAKKDRAKTKDISGRKLRTKNKSSAVRAVQTTPSRKPNRPSRGDRAVRSDKPVIKSSTARSARNNVYPQSGPYVNNGAKKPKQKQPTYSNRSVVKRLNNSANKRSRNNIYPQSSPYVNNPSKKPRSTQPVYSNKSVVSRNKQASRKRSENNIYPQKGPYVNNNSSRPKKEGQTIFNNRSFIAKALNLKSQPWPPGKGKGGARSGSGSYVTRGRKNVYWGKFRKGEKAITTDVAGRPLRTRNYRSPVMGLIPATNPYAYRKKGGDRAYRGPFRFGFSSASRSTQQAWTGDISGHRLRRGKVTKPTENAGQRFFPRKLSVSGSGKISKLKGGGYQSRSGKGTSNSPIPGKAPGIGASGILKNLNRITGRKTVKGGGSLTGKVGSNQPIPGKAPGLGAVGIGNYKGNYKKGTLSPGFREQGVGFSGSIKTKRPLKGGGSISGRSRNNNGNPVDVKAPLGKNAGLVGTFQGSIKARRPLKGGGSISGRSRNNYGNPVNVKAPAGKNAGLVGTFSGSIKTKRPAKGGGSISGRARNNNGNPIDVKAPLGKDAGLVGTFQGNIKGIGKSFRNQGEEYTGNIKAKRPAKGGGSISGRARNNDGNPINVKAPTGRDAARVGTFQGNAKLGELTPGFRNQGEEFTGYMKAKKRAKGGGSISGKLWNNNEKPIDVRTPLAEDAKAANYSGKIKLGRKPYVKNPNASDLALKQQRPDQTTYAVGGLQVKIKTGKYEHNKKSAKDALLAHGPGKNSVKASEYSGKMKVFWNYKQNPSSADEAQKAIAGSNAFYKSTAYRGRIRLTRNYRHNPSSDKDALKVFSPGRSYARINDFQGNFKMKKYGGKDYHPDSQFAHHGVNNVKEERTILTNVKLFWAKVFRKNSTQTKAVKQKVDRPRYDRNEKELWKDLYD